MGTCFYVRRRLAVGDILHHALNISAGDIPAPLLAEERLDMAFDTPSVTGDGGRPLGRAPLGDVKVTQFGNGQIVLHLVARIRRVLPIGNLPQQPLGLFSGSFRGPRRAVVPYGQPALTALNSTL